nr:immunoglobulin heavy chain junction region [Mus musculus]
AVYYCARFARYDGYF